MAGWQEQLDELLRERRPALIGYATMLTGDRVSAEDLVHDALVRTYGRPRGLPTIDAAHAYVRRAVATMYLDRLRSRRRFTAALPRLASPETRAEDDADGRLDVRAALGELPPRERACVLLRFYDDLTVPDIADVLGLRPGSVKRYLSDGIGRLGALLGTAAALDDPAAGDAVLGHVHIVERSGR